MCSIRCILATPASSKWKIHQPDINNVFLYGDLLEEVYVKVKKCVECKLGKAFLLKKSLYGLKNHYTD